MSAKYRLFRSLIIYMLKQSTTYKGMFALYYHSVYTGRRGELIINQAAADKLINLVLNAGHTWETELKPDGTINLSATYLRKYKPLS